MRRSRVPPPRRKTVPGAGVRSTSTVVEQGGCAAWLAGKTHPITRESLAAGHLVLEQATEFDARTVRILGRRLLEVVAPDLADQHEADLLEKEEAKAA
jgi:hypothetical protein